MRVEAVEPLEGDLWRVRLSDGTAVELSAPALAASGLAPGARLDAARLADLLDRARADRACRDALRLLSLRAHSRQDLRHRLERRGHDAAAVEQALALLARQGWLDDADFARQWARRSLARSPVGPERLITGLTRQGVDPDLAREAARSAVAEAAAPLQGGGAGGDAPADARQDAVEDAETLLAWEALQRRLARGFDRGDPRTWRRAFDYLRRRGFSEESAARALRRAGIDPDAAGAAEPFT
ncbi:MAG: regulatory protein RecX [Thermaerobacter sp.]